MQERLFSEAELREMEKRSVDRLTEAIEAGETEKAKQIAKRMYNEFLSMHDLYRNWTTAMLSEIGRRFGDQALDEIMTAGVKAWWLPNLEKMAEGSPTLQQRIKMFVACAAISNLWISKKTRKKWLSKCGLVAAAVGLSWKESMKGRTPF
jgi:hypothetical protein